ncbi:MAG: hypothetical protein M1816_005619 [Peltula sp. TS41687]|nr:MAG: hypothetical protein M1816_005619 [Peltula sp. TS41687]
MSITWNNDRPAGGIVPTFRYKLADNPALTVVGLRIDYPPDGSTPPHRHGVASVIGFVIEGEVVMAMNDGEPRTYKKGESWYEAPGCYHRISDNNSKTEGASIHATVVIPTDVFDKEGYSYLVQFDPQYLSGVVDKTKYAIRSIPTPW